MCVARPQQRDKCQQRNDGQILEQKDGERGTSVTRGELAFFGEDLQHERGRGHRQPQADDQRAVEVQAESERDDADQCARDQHLGGTESENRATQHPQARRLQFQANDEKQQHDADFREMQDVVDGGNELESAGTDDDAGREIAEHRAELEAPEQRHGNDRRGQEDGGFAENVHHLTPRPVLRSTPLRVHMSVPLSPGMRAERVL